jgi:hypothetical protein
MKAGTKVQDKKVIYDYQWGVLSALVSGYAIRNNMEDLAVWGMLAGAYDEGDGRLQYEVITNGLGLRPAIEKLGCGGTLIDLAVELFIRKEGDA